MTEADRIITDLKRLEPKLRSAGVTHLAIFGSRARGDHGPESDLDVLIDVAPERKLSLLNVIGVGHLIQDDLGIKTYVMTRRSLKDGFRNEIAADVREVF